MLNFVPKKLFLRGFLLHYFNMKKTAAESHRILVEVCGEHALADGTCQKWFAFSFIFAPFFVINFTLSRGDESLIIKLNLR